MSFMASIALQGAVYERLRDDPAVAALVGDAVYDAMPVSPPSGTHVSLGPEVVRDAGDMTAAGSEHDFTVSVLSGADQDNGGFGGVKAAAAAVAAALEGGEALALSRGRLAGLWFLRANARRTENGAGRRVDLTFRARVDLG
ncbi:DUF3168 domain-containing protein [Paracoccus sp. S-4012]|uniref:DUF3168 domain-containing protein n=1 Tax=Paracoccus sp. S-4012 TaxID=2665648 RepID=UPI0012AFED29|nr:DUF3168 domain-containing protein [Paracoccus sp. S-4012]MRX50686.1 DUF3168 domain-containing protein [Paracoccus sp. S-4012]